MKALVTGAAGFIGSHLCERLVALNWEVVGIDNFSDYYDRKRKQSNVAGFAEAKNFCLQEADLLEVDLSAVVEDVDVVFHQAGQPGVRASWSDEFDSYSRNNVSATQRVLEAVRVSERPKMVYASSSSVYGNPPSVPTTESSSKAPHSPYGVTKLAGELLCSAYANNYGIRVTSLRYFTVFGPRQRPDMAIFRMIQSALDQTEFVLFGDGLQIRDFTYVDDVVSANILAATSDLESNSAINIAGGSSISIVELLGLVGETVGKPVPVRRQEAMPGDVQITAGDISRARDILCWMPKTSLESGLKAQVGWQSRHST